MIAAYHFKLDWTNRTGRMRCSDSHPPGKNYIAALA